MDTASSEGVRLVTLPSVLFGYIFTKTRTIFMKFQECVVFNPFFFPVVFLLSVIFLLSLYFIAASRTHKSR